jgi:hypothetical protein
MSRHHLSQIALFSALSATLLVPLGSGWQQIEPLLTRWAPVVLRQWPEGAQSLSPMLCAMLLLGLALMEAFSRR